MKGRKPKPKSQPTTVRLDPPAELSAAAKVEWRRIVNLLAKSKLLSNLDFSSLFIFATSMAHYRHAEKQVALDGTVVIGTTGTPIKNPYLTVQKEAWERVRPLLAEFGLTPSSRARFVGKTEETPKGLPDF